jgi:Tfp pilus assembly major pilin PilA
VNAQQLPALTAQDGLTLIEVLIGMVIIISVVGAIAIGLVTNNESALGVQRQSQLLAVLQNRIEYVHQVLVENYASKGFAAISLSSNPPDGTQHPLPNDPSDPNDFITEWESGYTTSKGGQESFRIERNYNNTAEGSIETVEGGQESLEVDPTNGKIAPVVYVDFATGETSTSGPNFPSTHLYATVNTYVTLTKALTPSGGTSCSNTYGTGSDANDARRLVVAARLSAPGSHPLGSNSPQYATTVLTNPIPSNQCQGATGLTISPGVPVS